MWMNKAYSLTVAVALRMASASLEKVALSRWFGGVPG